MKKVETKKAPAAVGPYSQAIISNGLMYTSGQIPLNPKTGSIEAACIEVQTEQVIKNLTAVLEEAGSGLENVIKTTCYLKNIGNFAAFNSVYEKYFTGKPARSCVAVRELPKQVLCEIEAIALAE